MASDEVSTSSQKFFSPLVSKVFLVSNVKVFARAGVRPGVAGLWAPPGGVLHRVARQPRARRRQAHLRRGRGE